MYAKGKTLKLKCGHLEFGTCLLEWAEWKQHQVWKVHFICKFLRNKIDFCLLLKKSKSEKSRESENRRTSRLLLASSCDRSKPWSPSMHTSCLLFCLHGQDFWREKIYIMKSAAVGREVVGETCVTDGRKLPTDISGV